MNFAMEWAKNNVFIIVFLVLMVASMIALPLVARGMSADVRQEVQDRARRHGELRSLENTQIQPPPGVEIANGEAGRGVVVNENLLREYRSLVEMIREDADEVWAAALQHNRGDHRVIMPELFPEPPVEYREIYPEHFHQRLMAAYDELFRQINAGMPPSPESIRQDLERREIQFRTQSLRKERDERLTEEEQAELHQQLRTLRLLRYQEKAETISLFASMDSLVDIPRWDSGRRYSLAELFTWQWNYWIHADVMRGLAAANHGANSVLQGPLKRVISVQIRESTTAGSRGGTGTAGGGGPMLGSGGGGVVGSGGGTPVAGGGRQGAAPAGQPINPRAEVPIDYSVSVTGRKTNPLYDVRYVAVELIADSERIPEIIDALARQNFITVVNLRMRPVDPNASARSGFFFGAQPLAHVSLELETVWLRTWTSERMPEDLKRTLGIATEQPAAPVG